MLAALRDDIRFSLRQLARQPAFAAAAIATFALGTGAVTAMVTVVHGVLLTPLRFPEPDRLVSLCETHESVARFCIVSPPNAADWAAEARTIAGIGLARDWSFKIQRDGGTALRLPTGIATAALFRVLGVTPERGRAFTDEDETLRRPVVVLSHEAWADAFGADTGIVGRTVQLDGAPFEVIGVLPPRTDVPDLEYVRLWAPLHAAVDEPPGRGWRGFQAFARLAPGATIAGAEAELAALQRSLGERHPETNRGWGARVEPALARVVGEVRPTLLVFLAAAAVLLLTACANVANLLLARGAQREREFAVRAAVGAGAGRLFRLIAVESMVLAVLGGVLGLVLAAWATAAFLALVPGGLPRADEVRLDARVLGAALVMVVGASLLAGMGPALRAMRTDLATAIRSGRDAAGERRVLGLRGGFVAAEVALAFVLAVGSGLLARSYRGYVRWEPGFDRRGLTTFWLLASPGTYATRAQVVAVFDRVHEQLRSVPGVERVGMASSVPLSGGVETDEFALPGDEGRTLSARWYDVWPEYHATLGVALRRGRWLTSADAEGAPPVALVNETFARRAWPGADPVGQRLGRKGDEGSMEVVGVVADVPPMVPGQRAEPEVYWPYHQNPRWATYVVLRTRGAADVVLAMRERLRAVDPDLDPASVLTLEDRFAARLRQPRFSLLLIGAVALTAVLLGLIGVAGVTAATVARRTREFGVRVALGARPAEVVRMVVRQTFGVVLVVLGVGAAAAMLVTQLARVVIPGVRPTDPATFLLTAVVLAAVGAVACFMPARAAGRVDPMEALRAE